MAQDAWSVMSIWSLTTVLTVAYQSINNIVWLNVFFCIFISYRLIWKVLSCIRHATFLYRSSYEQLVFPFAIGLPDQPTIIALISLSRFLQNFKEKYP